MKQKKTPSKRGDRAAEAAFYAIRGRQRATGRFVPALGTGEHELEVFTNTRVLARVRVDASVPPKVGDVLLYLIDSDPEERKQLFP